MVQADSLEFSQFSVEEETLVWAYLNASYAETCSDLVLKFIAVLPDSPVVLVVSGSPVGVHFASCKNLSLSII